MPLIGSRAHASEANDIAEGLRSPDWNVWERLSGGSCRLVYLHKPSRVVYKVDSYKFGGYANSAEVRVARELRRESWEHVRIPLVSSFKFGRNMVVAMEYVEGDMGRDVARDHNKPAREEMFNKGRLEDMHGDNFMFERSSGKLVPIDLASPRRKNLNMVDRRVLSCGDGSVWA